MTTTSILNLALDYELDAKKYYLTLAGKRLKTKKANEIFTDSVIIVQAVINDYENHKFKSKWINLISSYVDFLNDEADIASSKEQLLSYLKNDLMLYLDKESTEFFKYQEATYLPLITKFEQLVKTQQKLVPTTGFDKVEFTPATLNHIEEYIEKLSLKDLFVSLFLTRISTSSILTTLYLSAELTAQEFYTIAFNAELSKLEKSHDDEEAQRLKIIKQELEIINYFARDGLL